MKRDLRKKIIDTLEGKGKMIDSIKEKIRNIELAISGVGYNSGGGDVKVTNLKICEKEKLVRATITLIEYDMGDGVSKKERLDDCKFPFAWFKELR
jgi:hypothetical protein